MAFRNHTNLAYSLVATAPSPASSGTSLVVTGGEGARFPDPATVGNYYATVGAANVDLHAGNAEIVLVTAKSTDTFTITRAQLGTSARSVIVGDRFFLGVIGADFTDLETDLPFNGVLKNGKIAVSVANNDLTVALKTLAGNDPSSLDPVTVLIGGTKRTITGALSVTKNDGTNWFNSGSAEIATKEVDYFVYLGYNATDGVVIGFARIPFARLYGDFSTTTTVPTYGAISTITNAAAGDDYVNIGRFAATLSAGAGYTWTVPTFTSKNLIQEPVYNTRFLAYTPVAYGTTGSAGSYAASNQVGRYIIENTKITIKSDWNHSNLGSWTGQLRHQLPFTVTAAEATHLQFLYAATVGQTATLNIEAGLYSVATTGIITFVSALNASIYDYTSLATGDWLSVNCVFEIG